MAPSKPTAVARLQARVADLEKQLEHWKRVAGHAREQAEAAEARTEKVEKKLTKLNNMAEIAEEDIQTGADYYHSPVIPVSTLKKRGII